MATYTLTKLRSGHEIDCETVTAETAEEAIETALGWLTDNERQFITYEATETEAEIDGVPVEEIAPGVYEGTVENDDGSIEDVVICDPMAIATYNGIPITEEE